jgi:hypothetical protein
MIQNLCNIIEEVNFDTFYKATIIEASQLPDFNHLTRDDEVLSIINSIPDSFQAMVIQFLPEKFSISSGTVIEDGNKNYQNKFSLPLVPQDANIQNLLETYNNKLVVAFITRHSHSYLYGTKAQPMLFTYDELHSPTVLGLKGYNLNMAGEGYGPPKYFAGKESDFPVVQRGLAFQLAGSI